MSTAKDRQHARRRLAALTFLSNISLDGTHRDTNLCVFNRRLEVGNYDRSPKLDGKCVSKLLRRVSNSDERLSSVCRSTTSSSDQSPRERVHSFVGDSRTKFCSVSQRRKQFLQQHIHSTCSSVDNVHGGQVKGFQDVHGRSDVQVLKTPTDKRIYDERVILVSSRRVPIVVFSSLPYNSSTSCSRTDLRQDVIRRRHTSANRQISVLNEGPDPLDLLSVMGFEKPTDGKAVSYSQFLLPSGIQQYLQKKCKSAEPEHATNSHTFNRCFSHDPSLATRSHVNTPDATIEKSLDLEEVQSSHPYHFLVYHPNLLDDPELIAGKHSTQLAFTSYITSVIGYVKPSDLKRELNEKFKERFPLMQLTLSKLRSLKKEMCKIAQECGIDLLTIAQAHVYFEKLGLKLLINKQNRKLCAASCLFLSAKLNDVKGGDLKNLLEKMESGFRLNRKDILNCEFGVLVALEFSLLLPTWEVKPHYQRLLYES